MDQFVSYAQNFEDVMLWRALKHIQNGFYVDVGANDPKIESVTQAFYERGWRGINIEPMQKYYEALSQERPDDINLPVAIDAREGEITLYEVPETGLTSAIYEFAKEAESSGKGSQVVERKVQALPLNKVLEEYAREPIHFLKVDVEGFETEVIKGLDLARWRPWIIVVEATIPNAKEASYGAWEPILLAGEYTFAYFDGLNRFYVSNEHLELLEAFAAPPNFFDHFITYQHAAALEQISWQDSVIKNHDLAMKHQDSVIKDQGWVMKNQDSILNQARQDLSKLNAEFIRTSKERDWLRQELNSGREEVENIRREYVNILYSKSYRITAPLRAFYGLLDKLRSRTSVKTISQNPNVPPAMGEITNDLVLDEAYYLNFFKREMAKRRSSE